MTASSVKLYMSASLVIGEQIVVRSMMQAHYSCHFRMSAIVNYYAHRIVPIGIKVCDAQRLHWILVLRLVIYIQPKTLMSFAFNCNRSVLRKGAYTC